MRTFVMPEIDLKYYYTDKDRHGNARHYWRKRIPGTTKYRKKRIKAEPGTEEFHTQFAAAMKADGIPDAAAKPETVQPAKPGSLRWLVARYYGSSMYKQLGKGTRAVRKRLLDGLCQEKAIEDKPGTIGDRPYAIPATTVQVLCDRKAEKPDAYNGRLKAVRHLFEYAVEDKALPMKRNPSNDVSYLQPKNKNGFHTWTVEEVAMFLHRHGPGTKARLALAIILLTGQRRSDIVEFGRQHIREARFMAEHLQAMHAGPWINFTQVKNRERKPVMLTIPVLPQLEYFLAQIEGQMTFLQTAHGKPYTANGFGNWFKRMCRKAGLPHCSAHGLRKAGATIAAENGATSHQLMGIFGWSTIKQAEVYTKKADQKRLAGSAMLLLMPPGNFAGYFGNECGPLPKAMAAGGSTRGELS